MSASASAKPIFCAISGFARMFEKRELVDNGKFLKTLYLASFKQKKKLLEKATRSQLRMLIKLFEAVLIKELDLNEENEKKLLKSKRLKTLHKIFSNEDVVNRLLRKTSVFQLRTRLISFVPLINIILSPLYVASA